MKPKRNCDYMEEEWRCVKGYEGLYQISNYGRVRSFHNNPAKILSLKNNSGWYLSFRAIDENGNRKTLRPHVEVAKAFLGEIPKGYHVHHKDGNKQNNRVDNLEIIHPSEHAKETIKQNANVIKGMNNYNEYIRPKRIRQYTRDGMFVAEYANAEIASRYSGVCGRNILQVARKEKYGKNGMVRKQAGGFVWKFADESEVV